MATPDQSIDQFKSQPRLPKFVAPKHYAISLTPDLAACTFAGSVRIAVEVAEPTRFLVLNVVDLKIGGDSVSFEVGTLSMVLKPVEIVVVEEDEIVVMRFEEELPRGGGVLGMRFEGTLNDQMKGFYRSVYEYNGEKRNMAVTQFEPTDARRCFPCWDEPAFKVGEWWI